MLHCQRWAQLLNSETNPLRLFLAHRWPVTSWCETAMRVPVKLIWQFSSQRWIQSAVEALYLKLKVSRVLCVSFAMSEESYSYLKLENFWGIASKHADTARPRVEKEGLGTRSQEFRVKFYIPRHQYACTMGGVDTHERKSNLGQDFPSDDSDS